MQVSVLRCDSDEVTLQAPLAPNINHQETVFGGSASAVAILAGWSLLHVRLAPSNLRHQLVIQRNTMHYDSPIRGPFTASAGVPDPGDWDAFLRTLERRHRARLAITCTLDSDGIRVGRLLADYVARRIC